MSSLACAAYIRLPRPATAELIPISASEVVVIESAASSPAREGNSALQLDCRPLATDARLLCPRVHDAYRPVRGARQHDGGDCFRRKRLLRAKGAANVLGDDKASGWARA